MRNGIEAEAGPRGQEAEKGQEGLAPLSPRDRGYRAFTRNIPLVSTPYRKGTPEYAQWRAGWRDAANDAEDGVPMRKIDGGRAAPQRAKSAAIEARFQHYKNQRRANMVRPPASRR